MRARLSMVGCIALIALPVLGVLVDRTAITVGNKVITDREIIRRIRLAAFQNGEPPDLSITARREAAQRLIDLKLVEREMDVGHYTRTPAAKADEILAAFTKEHFRDSSESVRLSLAAIDLTPADLRAEFAEQADLLLFTSLRFRPAVEVSDKEIEEYYENHIVAEALKTGAVPLSLADARSSIEEILANERADLDLDAWLQDQRKRTRIVYLEKELQEK
jgi:hypothetical protein